MSGMKMRGKAFTLVELPAVSKREAGGFTLVELLVVSKREAGGFTLVELLVVVSMIGVLAAMLTPSLYQAMVMTRRSACRSNLQVVGGAFRLYLHDSDAIMPIAAQMPSQQLNDDPRIADVLERYLSGPKALLCPADRDEAYFVAEGSSYEYQSMLGGRKVGDSFLTKRFGKAKTPVMNDYEPFHGRGGTPGAANYLFADTHVGDLTAGH